MKFNTKQLKAIETIDKNVGVIAGAGTGKTAVLTERFVKIIKNSDLDMTETIPKILAFTFTEKATLEMKERISKRVKDLDLIELNGRPVDSFLNIYTINGFCNQLLKESGHLIGLSTNFEVIEEFESNLILENIVNSNLNKIMHDDKFNDVLVSNNYLNITRLTTELISAYRRIKSKGFEISDLFSKKSSEFSKKILDDFVKDFIITMENWIESKLLNGRHNIVRFYNTSLKEKLINYKTTYDIEDTLRKILDLLDRTTKLKNNKESKRLKRSIYSILAWFEDDDFEYKTFEKLLRNIDKEFKKYKIDYDYVDFDDQLEYSLLILKKFPDVLNEYKKKYEYIMVDEFQDINYTQKDIIYLLSSDGHDLDRENLFIVGDPKQSIYGFRGSELLLFNECLKEISSTGGEIIELELNYRSKKNLIDSYNSIFKGVLGDDYNNIKSPFNDPGINPQISLYDDMSMGTAVVSIIEYLKINGLIKNYNQVGVLFPTTTRLGILTSELDNSEIPYNSNINPRLSENRLVLDIILMLRFLNDHSDNLSLYGLLKSPFFKFNDRLIDEVYVDRTISLYENLKACVSVDKQIIFAKNLLKESMKNISRSSIYNTISRFLLSFDNIFNEYDEEIKYTYHIFIEQILKFEMNEYYNLTNFINYWDTYLGDNFEHKNNTEDSNGVNLSTIHGSKGLEYDYVILYDIQNNTRSINDQVLVDGELGIGFNLKEKNSYYNIIRSKLQLEEIEEKKRLLYVSLTRAKKGYFITVDKSLKSHDESLFKLLSKSGYVFEETVLKDPTISKSNQRIEDTFSHSIILSDNQSIPMPTTSISAYNDYLMCPRLFYYKHKIKLDTDLIFKNVQEEEESNSANFGNFIHEIIERKGSEYNSFDEIDHDLIRKLCIEHNLDWNEIKTKTKRQINNYYKNKIDGDSYNEFGFKYKLSCGYIVGFIDEIVITKNKALIFDYKTGNHYSKDTAIRIYKNQMTLYRLVAEKLLNTDVDVYLNFLETGSIVKLEDKDYNKVIFLDSINKFLEFIRYNDDIESYPVTNSCIDNCKNIEICFS